MHAIDLAAELEGTGVTVTSLHPATDMPTGRVTRLGVEPQATIAEGALQLIVGGNVESGSSIEDCR